MARDRLAAIRAQQNAQAGASSSGRGGGGERYEEPSYPQQARSRGQEESGGRGYGRQGGGGSGRGSYEEDYREEYRPSGRGGYGDDIGSVVPPPPASRIPAAPQQQPSSRGGGGLPSGPRGGGGRRPNNPPAVSNSQEPYGRPTYGGGSSRGGGRGGGGSYDEPRDFDPNAVRNEIPEPRDFNPNQSQYTPAPPAVTRQRSLSGGARGRGGSGGGSSSRPIYQPPQSQQDYGRPPMGQSSNSDYYNDAPNNNLSASRAGQPLLSRSGRSAAPPYEEGGSYGGGGNQGDYQYSDKGSTVNLVEREEETFEMQRMDNAPRQKATVVGSGPGQQKKGGKTIKKGDVPMEDMSEFFAEISDLQQALREANNSIQQVQALHMRILSLPSADDPQAVALTANLKSLTGSTRSFFSSIKNRLQVLEQGNANLRALIPLGQSVHNLTISDVNVRQTQVDALKERFKEAIQRYAEVERDSRAKNRSRMERQVKIVNPGLSSGEVADVVRQAEEGGNNALFSQAVLQSNGQRSYAARGALREVESRAAELARIEQTLIELAQLFNDMAMMIEAQDVQIVEIEQKAVTVENDMSKGLQDTKKAVVSARNARKWRWICFGVIVVILIIVAIVVVVQVVIPLVNKNKANAAAAPAKTNAANAVSGSSSRALSTSAASATAAAASRVFSQSSLQANVVASGSSSSSTNWWDSSSSSSTNWWDTSSSTTDWWDSTSSSNNWQPTTTTDWSQPTTTDWSQPQSSSYNNYAVINTQGIASNAQYVAGSGNGGFLPTSTAAMAKGKHRMMMKRLAKQNE